MFQGSVLALEVHRPEERRLLELEDPANLLLVLSGTMDREEEDTAGSELVSDLSKNGQTAYRECVRNVPETKDDKPVPLLGEGSEPTVRPGAGQPFRSGLANGERLGQGRPGCIRWFDRLGLRRELN